MPSRLDDDLCFCLFIMALLILFGLIMLFIGAYFFLDKVEVTVTDVSLSRFALAPPGPNNNGTAAAALAYDISLVVSVHNPNWAMSAEHAAPLDADLSFAGQSLVGARLADAGRSAEPEKSDEVRLRAVGEKVLGSDGVAELVKETTAGELQSLELRLSGEIRYRPVHPGRYRLDVSCRLRLPTAVPGRSVMVSDKVFKCMPVDCLDSATY